MTQQRLKTQVLVIGAGISGSTSALTLADAGYEVTLIVPGKELDGGNSALAQGGIVYRSDPNDAKDLEKDILKIAVVERHKGTHHIGLGYIQGYGLKSGAVATSISHDSHNIIVVGTSEEDMAAAANRIVENRGGITVMDGGQILGEVALPIAGIMSDDSLVMVNSALEAAKDEAFRLGVSRGIDPFMTLSFMALPVIPSLRLTTRGVFDVLTQRYV